MNNSPNPNPAAGTDVSEDELRSAKKSFTWIGFGLALCLCLTVLVNYFLPKLLPEASPLRLPLCTAAMCLAVFPLGALLVRRGGKAEKTSRRRGGLAVFFVLLAVTVDLALAGEITGSFLFPPRETAAAGDRFPDAVSILLFAGVNGLLLPVCEEFLFRKVLGDALRQWGDAAAMLLGALFYAAFYGEAGSFLYALGLGACLMYAYLTTGKLRYPMLVHIFFNIFFSVVPALTDTLLCSGEVLAEVEKALEIWLLSRYTDYAGLSDLLSAHPGAIPALLLNAMTVALELGLALAGAFCLFFFRGRMNLQPGPKKLRARMLGDTVFLAPGIMVYLLLSAALAVLNFYL